MNTAIAITLPTGEVDRIEGPYLRLLWIAAKLNSIDARLMQLGIAPINANVTFVA